MNVVERNRPAAAIALLVVAIVSGALAGVVGAAFIWLYEEGLDLVWTDLPDKVGVAPYDSWWLFAILIGGGALVGICQRVIGAQPRPIDEAVATWSAGGHLPASDAPKAGFNSIIILVAGGPVGFEAALIGLLGGTASWINQRIASVGRLVRQAWGAERIDSLPSVAHHIPYWLAALSGLFTYKWLPFGTLDMGFRFSSFDGRVDVGEGLWMFGWAALVVVPAAWALAVVGRAEFATVSRRAPILIAMAGGLVFAILALGDDMVLFSGQQAIQQLPDATTGQLFYVTVFKWAALVLALLAGWRGGPIFPSFTSAAALGVLAADVVSVSPDLMMVAGIAAVSVAFCKSRLPLAFVLTLYPTPLSYAGPILIGCLGGALGLAVAGAFGAAPQADATTADQDATPADQ